MARVLVSGLTNIETTLRVDDFPIPYFPVRYPFFGIGSSASGVGYNVAAALTTLGDEVRFLSLIGGDAAGALLAQALAQSGISGRFVLPLLAQTVQSVIQADWSRGFSRLFSIDAAIRARSRLQIRTGGKMYAPINGIRMAYFERGKVHDTTLLLIHGFPLDHRLWAAQIRGLSNEVRVLAPDLRGHGRSGLTPGPLAMAGHADDLAALLDRLGIGRAVVAGLSMGGYVALAFWRRHRDRVQALALLDTRAEADSAVARAGRDAAVARVQQTGAAAIADEMLPRLLAPAGLAHPKIAAVARRMMVEQPVAGIVGALGGLRDREDSRPTLATITVPTLVVVGQHDAITPPADAQALAAGIPGARLVTIPGAGHLSPMENPRAVNAALRSLLRSVG